MRRRSRPRRAPTGPADERRRASLRDAPRRRRGQPVSPEQLAVPDAGRRLLEATELVDLHIHVGAAVAPHVLWEIAHDHGFKLPVRTYPEFQELVYADPNRVTSLDGYLEILHRWTERIQSSPAAIERSVYSIIGKE